MENERFRTYSFVDRIVSVDPGTRIRGRYEIPAGVSSFPLPLVAEATGQLAAWAAMEAMDYAVRPVAGIAGGVELLREVKPGQTLELEAEIEQLDTAAIGYSGTARVDGHPVVRLEHCVGPMVAMADFDDPAAVRARYELLSDGGAEPGAFQGVPEIVAVPADGEDRAWMSARLKIPESAPFFGDHFPRRPVFPGTLMMDVNNRLASSFMTGCAPPEDGRAWRVRGLSNMKMRSFIPPGEDLETRVTLREQSGDEATIEVETRNATRRVSGGRMRMVVEEVAE